jgi:hypothetical protein
MHPFEFILTAVLSVLCFLTIGAIAALAFL